MLYGVAMFPIQSPIRWGFFASLGLFIVGTVAHAPAANTRPAEVSSSRPRPIPAFVRNAGQAEGQAEFVSAGGAHDVFFTPTDVRIANSQRAASLWLTFLNSAATALEGARATGGVVNYVRAGRISSERAFGEVVYRDIWPGIDAHVVSTVSGLEYTFEVGARRDPRVIRLRYDGATGVAFDAGGNLIIDSPAGRFIDHAPVVHQVVEEGRLQIPSRFVLKDGVIGFELADYDRRYPITIDPTLVYSTYLGGSGFDAGNAIAVDAQGAAYVAGVTKFVDFPSTPGAFDPTWNGGTGNQPSDAFVGKLNPAGDRFDYLTFLGGAGNDEALGVAVDGEGQAYVTGFTESPDFPATSGAFRTSIGVSFHDGFLTKLNASGSGLLFSTFFGSNGATDPVAVSLDPGQHAYVAGNTSALNLPTTPGAIGPPHTSTGRRDAFLLKFDTAGANVVYGTYVGGAQEDLAAALAVSSSGRAFLTGSTASLDLRTTPSSVQPAPAGATFKSSDGGDTWQRGNGGAKSQWVLAIAIDPVTPSIVYEGTQDLGVLKSVDGGMTWAPANAGFAQTPRVNDLATDPGTSGIVLAATGDGIYRSLDAGQSWNAVGPSAQRIAISPSNPSFAYAASALGAYKSSDGGATWTHVLNADLRSVAIDPANAMTVFVGGSESQVFKTTNGGVTWSNVSITGTPKPHVQALAVSLSSSNTVYAGLENSGVFRSTDGGATWMLMSIGPSTPTRMVVDEADANTFYIAGTGAIAVTRDGGSTWDSISIAGNNLTIYALDAHAGTVFTGIVAQTEAFVDQIDTTSSTDGLVYATYLGGAGPDGGRGIALDPSGNAVVVASASPEFRQAATPPGSAPRVHAFVRLNPTGTVIAAASRIGPAGTFVIAAGVAVDATGVAYVTGVADDDDPHVWIDRVEQDGLVSSEFFINGAHSGLGSPGVDQATAVALDAAGNVYITGNTTSSDYPTTPNAPQRSYGSGARWNYVAHA